MGKVNKVRDLLQIALTAGSVKDGNNFKEQILDVYIVLC